MNRQEHLAWCKQRALEYCDNNEPTQAWASMVSDLNEHDETRGHIAIDLGMSMLLAGIMNGNEEVIKFINGFN